MHMGVAYFIIFYFGKLPLIKCISTKYFVTGIWTRLTFVGSLAHSVK